MSQKTRAERGDKSTSAIPQTPRENTDPTPIKRPDEPLPTPGPVQTPHTPPLIAPETPGAPMQVPSPSPSSGVTVDKALVERLMGALAAERNTAPSDEATYAITNVGGCSVAFPVTDARNGAVRTISLDRRGASAKITKAQVLEVRTAHPHFFDNGHLSAVAVVADGPNTIHSLADFIAAIPPDGVTASIEKITSIAALYDLYNFIENQRFLHEDENGRAFIAKGTDGKDMIVVHEVTIPVKTLAIEIAVQRRLDTLAGVRVALDA
jgi:hypothetical protein